MSPDKSTQKLAGGRFGVNLGETPRFTLRFPPDPHLRGDRAMTVQPESGAPVFRIVLHTCAAAAHCPNIAPACADIIATRLMQTSCASLSLHWWSQPRGVHPIGGTAVPPDWSFQGKRVFRERGKSKSLSP